MPLYGSRETALSTRNPETTGTTNRQSAETTASLNRREKNMDEMNAVTTTENVDATVAEPETKATEPEKAAEQNRDSAEVERLKRLLSKANSEASRYKDALREKQTEAERAEAERAEAEQAMKDELETLRKEKAISDYKNRALALNFDADNADKLANALAEGDTDAMFDALKAFTEATVTKANNEALNRQPGLSAGVPPTKQTAIDNDMEQMRRWMGAPTHR